MVTTRSFAQLSVNLEWLYISNKWISISMHYDWLLKLGISTECPLVNLQNIVDAHEINHLHSQVLSRKIVQQAVLWTCTPTSPKIIWIPWETFWNIKMKVLYWKIVNVSYLLCAGTEIYSMENVSKTDIEISNSQILETQAILLQQWKNMVWEIM